MSGLYPGARLRLIPAGANDPPINPRVAILHVAVSMAASLFSFFKFRSGGIESHFYVNWRGVVEQYRNIYRQADANHLANDFAVSIETAGFALGWWNPLQKRAIKKLLLWLHAETDGAIPLSVPGRWDGSGVGYHIQFGSPGFWTPVAKACPGRNRIKQYHRWLVPWMRTALTEGDWFDMADKGDLKDALREVLPEILDVRVSGDRLGTDHDWDLEGVLAHNFKSRQVLEKRLRRAIKREFNATEEQLDRIEAALDEGDGDPK